MITTREFVGRRAETEEAYAAVSPASQGALRQFSMERLIGYGVAPADAVELRAAVFDGADWQQTATRLAETALVQSGSTPTRVAALRRASALLRMSQLMIATDTDERRAIFTRAASLFAEAAALAGNGLPALIKTNVGPLAGWMYRATGEAIGTALVIGGVEGWAMDFSSQGEALAARGINALMLDGPGQGESRFAHQTYLGGQWKQAYIGAIDWLAEQFPAHKIVFVGNSLGGSIAMTIAAADGRIHACVANGAIVRARPPAGAPGSPPPSSPPQSIFLAKMLVASGYDDPKQAMAAFAMIDPLTPVNGKDYPLLILHGGKDMAVPMAAAQMLIEKAPTNNKELIIFSNGDHCLYNHRDDRDVLIADWVMDQLVEKDAV